jgi:hypothetical protein
MSIKSSAPFGLSDYRFANTCCPKQVHEKQYGHLKNVLLLCLQTFFCGSAGIYFEKCL